MLDPDVSDAVAVACSASSGKYYAVQMFGRPRYTLEGKRFDLPADAKLPAALAALYNVPRSNAQPDANLPDPRPAEFCTEER